MYGRLWSTLLPFTKIIRLENIRTSTACLHSKLPTLTNDNLQNFRPCFRNSAGNLHIQMTARNFSTLVVGWRNVDGSNFKFNISKSITDFHSILSQPCLHIPLFQQPHRNHIKFSFGKAKQKTVKPAVRRFFRLHWGAWIRTKCGRAKKLWKKKWKRKQRLRRHVFCNSTQNQLLNHMVTRFWKTPKYYVDDPYEPYHVRHGVYRRSPHNPL